MPRCAKIGSAAAKQVYVAAYTIRTKDQGPLRPSAILAVGARTCGSVWLSFRPQTAPRSTQRTCLHHQYHGSHSEHPGGQCAETGHGPPAWVQVQRGLHGRQRSESLPVQHHKRRCARRTESARPPELSAASNPRVRARAHLPHPDVCPLSVRRPRFVNRGGVLPRAAATRCAARRASLAQARSCVGLLLP